MSTIDYTYAHLDTKGTSASSSVSYHQFVKETSYVITYTSTCGYIEVRKEPEEVNLTDWRGLSRWFVGFSGIGIRLPVGHVIRQPMVEFRQKRKMRIQKLKQNL